MDCFTVNTNGKAEFESVGEGNVIVISKNEAQNAFKLKLNNTEHLIITDGELYSEDGRLILEHSNSAKLKIYPALKEDSILERISLVGTDGDFCVFELARYSEKERTEVIFKKHAETTDYIDYAINLRYPKDCPEEVYLDFNFSADLAEIIIDGEKVNDMLYTGMPFEVSMRYYDFPRELTLRLHPLSKDADVYLERTPIYNERGIACSLDSITAEDVYRSEISVQ